MKVSIDVMGGSPKSKLKLLFFILINTLDIKSAEYAVYDYLLFFTKDDRWQGKDKSKIWTVETTYKDIKQFCGIERNTAKNAIRNLEQKGLIKRVRIGRKNVGRSIFKIYSFETVWELNKEDIMKKAKWVNEERLEHAGDDIFTKVTIEL